MVKGDLHDPLDAQPVDVPHGEVLDPQVLQDVTGTHNMCSKPYCVITQVS